MLSIILNNLLGKTEQIEPKQTGISNFVYWNAELMQRMKWTEKHKMKYL